MIGSEEGFDIGRKNGSWKGEREERWVGEGDSERKTIITQKGRRKGSDDSPTAVVVVVMVATALVATTATTEQCRKNHHIHLIRMSQKENLLFTNLYPYIKFFLTQTQPTIFSH